MTLKKRGINYIGLCPFHNDSHPSFSVSPTRGICHCFTCGKGGNAINFLMELEQMTYPDALRWLAKKYNIEIQEREMTSEEKQRESERESMFIVNEWAAKYFQDILQNDVDGRAIGMQYFRSRGFRDDIIRKFQLGFALPQRTALFDEAVKKGYNPKYLTATGLCFKVDKDEAGNRSGQDQYLDRFSGRAIFPWTSVSGKIVAFGGRVLDSRTKGVNQKYVNSPDSEIYHKERELYGLYQAKKAIAKEDCVYMVEGYTDVISMHQAGFNQAVASLGTAFTSEQALLLKRYTDKVLLAYDSDGAGVKAALRGIGILKQAGLSGKVINMRPYKDPDEFIKNLGKEEFQNRIDNAENSFLFEIRIMEQSYDLNDPDSKTRFYTEIAKKLCEFEVDVERENYIEAIAEKYHIGFDNLRKLVNSYAAKNGMVQPAQKPKSGLNKKNSQEDNGKRVQKLLLTWITDYPEVLPKITRFITPSDFTEELYRKVADKLFADIENGRYNPASIISMFEDENEQREAAELFNTKVEAITTSQEKERAFHDIVYAVKKNSYEFYSGKLGSDVTALNQVIAGKKALEELAKTHISLN